MMYTRYQLQGRSEEDILHIIRLERVGAKENEAMLELEMGEGGYSLERAAPSSLFEPFRTTRLSIPIISTSHYMLETILIDNQEWLVSLFVNGEVIFKGMLERDLYEEEYQAIPYEVSLTAVCGLSRLSDLYLNINALQEDKSLKTNLNTMLIEDYNRATISLQRVISSCLKQLPLFLPIDWKTAPLHLQDYYIDPEGWRTSKKTRRNTDKVSDVLSSLLRSLSLVCYQYKGKWIIERISSVYDQKATKILDTQEFPLYGSPSLSSNSPYGSVRINLAQDRHDSLFRLAPPTFPLKQTNNINYSIGKSDIAPNVLCVTKQVESLAPNQALRSKGIIAILKNKGDDNEGLQIACPIHLNPNIKDISVSIELGIDKETANSLSEKEDSEFQVMGLLQMGNKNTIYYSAHYGQSYDVRGTREELYQGGIKGKNEKPHIQVISNTLCYHKGIHKEEHHSVFSSPYATCRKDVLKEGENEESYSLSQFPKLVRNHLPWQRIACEDLQNENLQTFSFKASPPWDTIRYYDRLKRNKYKREEAIDATSLLFFSLPFRFYHIYKERDRKENKVERISPQSIYIGKINVSYEYFKADEVFEEFFVADLGNEFVREGEPIDLSLATEIKGIQQAQDLKGMLFDVKGIPIKKLYEDTDIVQDAAQEFFSVYSKKYDILTAELDSALPMPLDCPYQMATRPGHSYLLIGSVYKPFQKSEEITLHEMPQTDKEESRYVRD